MVELYWSCKNHTNVTDHTNTKHVYVFEIGVAVGLTEAQVFKLL